MENEYNSHIEAITEALKREMKEQGVQVTIPEMSMPFTTVPGPASASIASNNAYIQQSIVNTQCLKENRVLFYHELSSQIRPVRGLVILIKRIIRKLVRFLLEPILEEENQNRIYTVEAMEALQQFLVYQERRNLVMEEMVKDISALQEENSQLRKRVESLCEKAENAGS